MALASARPASLRINKFNVVRQDDPSHPKDVIAAEGNKPKFRLPVMGYGLWVTGESYN